VRRFGSAGVPPPHTALGGADTARPCRRATAPPAPVRHGPL